MNTALWHDLSDEEFRTYKFPTGEVTIIRPSKLKVTPPAPGSFGGGSHRVLDDQGFSHYIPYGWLQITWKVKEGREPFAF